MFDCMLAVFILGPTIADMDIFCNEITFGKGSLTDAMAPKSSLIWKFPRRNFTDSRFLEPKNTTKKYKKT